MEKQAVVDAIILWCVIVIMGILTFFACMGAGLIAKQMMGVNMTQKINPIFEIFGDLSRPPKQQTEKEKSAGAFKQIFEDCKKALEEKDG